MDHMHVGSLPPRQFIIHADANQAIGSGHVLRLIPIAEELIAMGNEVIFTGNISEISWISGLLQDIGISKFYSIQDFHFSHASQTLIFDSYTLQPDDKFLDLVNWESVISIVDNNSPKYHAHLYINPYPFTNWEPPAENKKSRVLSGLDYVLLRKSLRHIKELSYLSKNLVPRLLVSGGGVDKYNFCNEFAQVLREIELPFKATIFTSNQSDKVLDSRISYELIGKNFDDFIFGTDVFFTTAGLTSWELMANGGVVGVVSSVDNQNENYTNITKNNLGIGVGKRNNKGDWAFDVKAVRKLIADSEHRLSFSLRTKKLIPVHGTKNTVSAILEV